MEPPIVTVTEGCMFGLSAGGHIEASKSVQEISDFFKKIVFHKLSIKFKFATISLLMHGTFKIRSHLYMF